MALVATHVEAASPRRSKIDRLLRESLRTGAATQNVIITVKPGYRDQGRKALEAHGDVIRSEHPLVDALSAEVHSADVNELANQPWVVAVSANAVVSADAVSTAGSMTAAVSLKPSSSSVSNTLRDTLGLPHVADGTVPTGATGVTVAVIDSGIAPSDDFLGRITGFYDFTNGGRSVQPFDDFGHGTHIAGLIGSSGKLSNYEYQGIAPDVHFVGLKVLDAQGQGKTSDVIAALEFVIANKSWLNVQIVNLSLGHPIYAPAEDDPLVLAVERATAAGLIVVTAAGNNGQTKKNGDSGYTGISSPGNAPSAITVGAAATQNTTPRSDDVIASYSSRGPTWFNAFAKPDVVAPGDQLVSDTSLTSYLYKQLVNSHKTAKNGQPLLQLSGTSMATGVTSGVVALMVQQHNQNGFKKQKALTANLVKAMLEFSAIPVPGFDRLTQGTGEINAAGALELARAIDTSRSSGSWWLAGGVTPFTVIGGETAAWSQQITWGSRVYQGTALYYNKAVWGSNIVWGTLFTDDIVWGTIIVDDIVWGTTTIWASDLVWTDRVIGQTIDDNIVWGTFIDDNIVWGTSFDDNIVWGTSVGDDNIVWGTAARLAALP